MKKTLAVIFCLAFGTSATPANGVTANAVTISIPTRVQGGEVFRHQEAGVQFELPKGWRAKPEGDVITVSSPDDALQMVFWAPDKDTFDAAVKDLDKELGKTIKNIKTTGKPIEDNYHGMPHFSESGTGEVEGTTIQWSVDVLSAKKVVIILSFAAPGVWDKYSEEGAKFINSIKKIE